MHTEEEARTKWCPEVRINLFHVDTAKDLVSVSATSNRHPQHELMQLPTEYQCIAGSCMHWRWQYPLTVKMTEDEAKARRGYCGLSGEPRDGWHTR